MTVIDAIRGRAKRAKEWLDAEIAAQPDSDGWLPLSVCEHFDRDVPLLIAAAEETAEWRTRAEEAEKERDALRVNLDSLTRTCMVIGGERDAAMRNWVDAQDAWESTLPLAEAALAYLRTNDEPGYDRLQAAGQDYEWRITQAGEADAPGGTARASDNAVEPRTGESGGLG